MTPEPVKIAFEGGSLSAELIRPRGAGALLVLAHGAGAGFRHRSLTAVSEALAARRVASLRFNFPFMEAGRRRTDPKPVAVAAVAAAVRQAGDLAPELRLFAGGHSFGGRMTSHAAAEGALAAAGASSGPAGLVFLSFPLHPAGRPGVGRAAHLPDVRLPMLFLSGTRDALAEAALLTEVLAGLPHARLHWLEDADHGYRVRKSARRDPRSVFEEIAGEAAAFVADCR